MTKRDFLVLFIKIIGIYLTLQAIVNYAMSLAVIVDASYYSDTLLYVGINGMAIVLFALPIFFAGPLVDRLNLTKGLDSEKIEFHGLKATDILQVGIILLGGFLLVEKTLDLFRQSLTWIYMDINALGPQQSNWYPMGWSFLQALVGFLLLTNFRAIARWIWKQGEKNKNA
ncbi:MAG: hypothetical protein SchgKO_16680 [Schleiferiaceae bacterium]